MRPHCISVILISLLCRSCMFSKSITVCGSILVHWCLSGSRDRSESSQILKNTLKTETQVSPGLSLCLSASLPVSDCTFDSVSICVFELSLKSVSVYQHVLADQLTLDIQISLYPSGCRYYGLSVWFPDVIKHLQADDYASKVKIHSNECTEDFTFNFTLENQIHKNGLFINDR